MLESDFEKILPVMKAPSPSLLWAVVACWLFPVSASACLWDRDTLRDEKDLHPGIYDLITGRIPHHGDAYYEARIKRIRGEEEKRALTDEEKNDLAVAMVRLKRFDEAHQVLSELIAADPSNYYAQSNLGVLEKKRGNYALAAEYIEKALQLKPGGHMGLGTWYLDQLVYRAALAEDPDLVPKNNFLGISYQEAFELNAMSIPHEGASKSDYYRRLQRLIQNDRTFPDGYVVMGDYLSKTGELNLAFLAYTKAIDLGHSNPDEIRRRRRALLRHFEEYVDRKRFFISSSRTRWWSAKIKEAQEEIAAGDAWLEEFQSVEARLVETKQDLVSFDDVYEARPRLQSERD